MSELQASFRKIELENETLRADAETQEIEHEEEISRLKIEHTSNLKRTIAQMTASHDAAMQEVVSSISETKSAYEAQLATLKTQYEETAALISQECQGRTQQVRSSLTSQVTALNREVAEKDVLLEKLSSELAVCKHELVGLRRKHELLSTEHERVDSAFTLLKSGFESEKQKHCDALMAQHTAESERLHKKYMRAIQDMQATQADLKSKLADFSIRQPQLGTNIVLLLSVLLFCLLFFIMGNNDFVFEVTLLLIFCMTFSCWAVLSFLLTDVTTYF